jgi:DNA-binding Xre family transcriptional regulator
MLKKKRKSIYIPTSSVVLDLKPILTKRNITYSSTFLTKIGIPINSATKMLKGESIALNYAHLTKLCLHLNCTPNDLFSVRSMELDEQHALKKLRVYSEAPPPNIAQWLAGKSIEEIEDLMKM